MEYTSYLKDLSCSSCGNIFPTDKIQNFCMDCNAPLLANYDLENLRNRLDRDEIHQRSHGMWRWYELLPLKNVHAMISLGEGDTPLLPLNRIGHTLGLSHLYLKEEGLNPTGSFKARGLSAAVSKACELGIKKIVLPSAGNAGGALAAYAARAGLESLIIMPKNTPLANIVESRAVGASVRFVDGLISDAARLAEQIASSNGYFNMSTFKEPYRVEGKKTMGYEIAESLDWILPDVIIYPTGGGTGLVAMWKAFLELEALGWLNSAKKPRMVVVQADGCAPVVKAYEANRIECEFWQGAHTLATGLCVSKSFADKLILRCIRESHGTAISVSDDEIMNSRQQLATAEGIFTCPEGAATLAGLIKLVKRGLVNSNEQVIIFNTGSGLKYLDLNYSN